MAKIRGFYKGFKFISQMFVVKEQEVEMEIGCPTDVKHVAHIGWDGPSGNGPAWMKEFSKTPEFQSSLQDAADDPGPNPTDYGFSHSQAAGTGNSVEGKSTSGMSKDDPTSEALTSKKKKRKEIKSLSSSAKSTSKSSLVGNTKLKQPEMQSFAVAAAS
ncbi:hypothetical protein MLD38_019393 [Melastoma candidum]|uniref:Uncharacterized protein n=1 Tax=Melastoma candidum TaxID=119954 RepID=A0ACB9QWY7_9MYRT|nr:hypothetical protein MLD38_019393 [Melastoma candidum]